MLMGAMGALTRYTIKVRHNLLPARHVSPPKSLRAKPPKGNTQLGKRAGIGREEALENRERV